MFQFTFYALVGIRYFKFVYMLCVQESLELEKYQNMFGFEHSSKLANLPPNSKECNTERNLAEEKLAAENLGLYVPKDPPTTSTPTPLA